MRRWKRRIVVAALLAALAVLAVPATVGQAVRGLTAHLGRRHVMGKLVPLVGLLAAAVAVGTGTLASASPTSAAQALTLVAVEQRKSEVLIDTGRKGDSEGDGVVFGETLLRDGKRVGRTSIMCVFTRAVARCNGTLWIPGGTIEAGGAIRGQRAFTVPVLGGTGRYAGVRGVLRITALSDRRSRYVVDLVE